MGLAYRGSDCSVTVTDENASKRAGIAAAVFYVILPYVSNNNAVCNRGKYNINIFVKEMFIC